MTNRAKIRVAGIVLAAGLSSRFGGEKLLADLDGEPLARKAMKAAARAGLEPLILVTRAELEEPLIDGLRGWRAVINPDPEEGQSGSLKAGLAALPGETTHALILLADQPLITAELLTEFIRLAQSGVKLAALDENQKLTPPTLFSRDYFPRLRAQQGDRGGRDILTDPKEKVYRVRPSKSGLSIDVDRPDDLKEIQRRRQ